MSTEASAGPLQALIDEIDFNLEVSSRRNPKELGCPFADHQFRRAIQSGAMAALDESIKTAINAGYADVGRANHFLLATHAHAINGDAYNTALNSAQQAVMAVPTGMKAARDSILAFLNSD